MGMPPSRFNKKGKGKKVQDTFEKKDWYNIKAPKMFASANAGVTPVNRTSGNNIASDKSHNQCPCHHASTQVHQTSSCGPQRWTLAGQGQSVVGQWQHERGVCQTGRR